MIKPDAWAIQFEVGFDFKLQAFEDYTVSLKKHLSNKTALRLNMLFQNTNANTDLIESDPGDTLDTYDNVHDVNTTVSLNLMSYITPHSNIKAYWGTGPVGGYVFRKRESDNGSTFRFEKSTEWFIGLEGLLGAEWFPMDNLSFFAEYNARLFYGKEDRETNSRNASGENSNRKTTIDNSGFSGDNAKLGIAVYF